MGAVIFRSDGTVHPGPRNDWGLWSKTGGTATNVVFSKKFIEFAGKWRLGDVDGNHLSLAHKDATTGPHGGKLQLGRVLYRLETGSSDLATTGSLAMLMVHTCPSDMQQIRRRP